MQPPPTALYVHIPFCEKLCPYCDFNTFSHAEAWRENTVAAICAEIAQTECGARTAATIFFGGGTPTYLSPHELQTILNALSSRFHIDDDAELTSEANPAHADAARFSAMFEMGFNRLSLGVQSLDADVLKSIGRTHTPAEAKHAVAAARNAGFSNISIDLMFGLPEQTLEVWQKTLRGALDLGLQHFSIYGLTIEPGTRFERLHKGGHLVLPSSDEEADMYLAAEEILTEAGYEHYEISNYALPGYRSRHNLTYWHNREYVGFGPGAVSYLDGVRRTNIRHPLRYAKAVAERGDVSEEFEPTDSRTRAVETLMLGLRLQEGVEWDQYCREHGNEAASSLLEKLRPARERGWLVTENGRVCLTPAGRMQHSEVTMLFL
jgi:oxygen-independent coproporphyrinogen-3 oxidase